MMMQRALTYGTAAAIGTAAWMMIEYAAGLHGEHAALGRWTGFVGLVFPVAAIFLAVRAQRRDRPAVTSGSAFAQGALVSAVFAWLSAAAVWLYFAWVNPDFRIGGHPVDIGEQAAVAAFGGLAAGLVVSAIVALVMRSRVVPAKVTT